MELRIPLFKFIAVCFVAICVSIHGIRGALWTTQGVDESSVRNVYSAVAVSDGCPGVNLRYISPYR